MYLILTGKTTKEHQLGLDVEEADLTICTARGPRLFNVRSLVDPDALDNEAGKRRSVRELYEV